MRLYPLLVRGVAGYFRGGVNSGWRGCLLSECPEWTDLAVMQPALLGPPEPERVAQVVVVIPGLIPGHLPLLRPHIASLLAGDQSAASLF